MLAIILCERGISRVTILPLVESLSQKDCSRAFILLRGSLVETSSKRKNISWFINKNNPLGVCACNGINFYKTAYDAVNSVNIMAFVNYYTAFWYFDNPFVFKEVV
jgi:hypothetical protein